MVFFFFFFLEGVAYEETVRCNCDKIGVQLPNAKNKVTFLDFDEKH